jgi:hypothetical protein
MRELFLDAVILRMTCTRQSNMENNTETFQQLLVLCVAICPQIMAIFPPSVVVSYGGLRTHMSLLFLALFLHSPKLNDV